MPCTSPTNPAFVKNMSIESLFTRKIAFGTNSPSMITTSIERTISSSNLNGRIREVMMSAFINSRFQNVETSRTNIVRKKLNPTIEDPMKRDGDSNNPERNIAAWEPCFFFSSIFKRLALAKAISMPEKNTINKNAIQIAIITYTSISKDNYEFNVKKPLRSQQPLFSQFPDRGLL